MTPGLQRSLVPLSMAVLASLAACQRSHGDSTTGPPVQASVGTDAIAAVPLGDVAGAAKSMAAAAIPNPYGDNPQAAQQGQDLFVKMNCAGCHGYGAKGGMGPNLTDTYWRYGGTPAMIFKSIYEGRPQGMPAWNPALPPDDIWKLVAYIESLGGAYKASQAQAAIQGDRIGDTVAPEVAKTLTGAAAASGPLAKSGDSKAQAEARPDAAGATPQGSKP